MKFASLLCEFREEKNEEGHLVIQRYVSLGRVSFWITFFMMTSFWFGGGVVPTSLYNTFFLMVAYNFFKKSFRLLDGNTLLNFLKKNN